MKRKLSRWDSNRRLSGHQQLSRIAAVTRHIWRNQWSDQFSQGSESVSEVTVAAKLETQLASTGVGSRTTQEGQFGKFIRWRNRRNFCQDMAPVQRVSCRPSRVPPDVTTRADEPVSGGRTHLSARGCDSAVRHSNAPARYALTVTQSRRIVLIVDQGVGSTWPLMTLVATPLR